MKIPFSDQIEWQTNSTPSTLEMAHQRWVELCQFSGMKPSLGITDTGEWVKILAGQAKKLDARDDFVALLPLLDLSRRQIENDISSALDKLGIRHDGIAVLPFEGILDAALTSHSTRWITLALCWLEQGHVSSRLMDSLMYAEVKAPTQPLRHRAKRLRYLSRNEAG